MVPTWLLLLPGQLESPQVAPHKKNGPSPPFEERLTAGLRKQIMYADAIVTTNILIFCHFILRFWNAVLQVSEQTLGICKSRWKLRSSKHWKATIWLHNRGQNGLFQIDLPNQDVELNLYKEKHPWVAYLQKRMGMKALYPHEIPTHPRHSLLQIPGKSLHSPLLFGTWRWDDRSRWKSEWKHGDIPPKYGQKYGAAPPF